MFSDHKTIIKDYASMVGKPDMVYESLRKDGTAFQRITCKTSQIAEAAKDNNMVSIVCL